MRSSSPSERGRNRGSIFPARNSRTLSGACLSWNRSARRTSAHWLARWPSSAAATPPSIPRAAPCAWAPKRRSSIAASAKTCPPSTKRCRQLNRRGEFVFLAAPHRIVGASRQRESHRDRQNAARRIRHVGPPQAVPTGEVQRFDCDTVILAVGETSTGLLPCLRLCA